MALRLVRAHPRSRGEHRKAAEAYADAQGSSPLTRGALSWRTSWVTALGLIPAHAGSTPCAGLEPAECPAHPRSRGEHKRVS